MTDRLENFRAGYAVLAERVRVALRVQLGDESRLTGHRDEALNFLSSADPVRFFFQNQRLARANAAAEQHRHIFPPDEFAILRESIGFMVEELEKACTQSSDPCDQEIVVVERCVAASGAGRPRIEFDKNFLSRALDLRGVAGVAAAAGVSPRTVRRRAQEAGLKPRGDPVYTEETAVDGSRVRKWNPHASQPASTLTDISDDELDRELFALLQLFPRFGRAMISGQLRSKGIRIARSRLRLSYLRVHGTPTPFGDPRIGRKKYSVPGVNSLWHHDGQHGKPRRRRDYAFTLTDVQALSDGSW
jgi:hypothetical protein